MNRGTHPKSLANLIGYGRTRSREVLQVRAAEGQAYARAWRIKNKPIFDAMYGATPVRIEEIK